MKKPAILSLAAIALAATLPMTPAQAGTKLGLLSCQSDGALAYVVGSRKDYLCVFRPADGGAREPYLATLDNVGVDLGITGRQDLSWIVYAGSFQEGEPVSLQGDYYGVSADASVAAGGGAKILAGGPSNGFTLQSVSLQGQFGLNATAALSRLSLTPAPTEPVVYKP
jgi:hypothetical protein